MESCWHNVFFLTLPLQRDCCAACKTVARTERFRAAAQLNMTPRAVFRSIELPLLRQIPARHSGVDLCDSA